MNSARPRVPSQFILMSFSIITWVCRLKENMRINLIKLTVIKLLRSSGPWITIFYFGKHWLRTGVSLTCHRAVGWPWWDGRPPLVEKDVGCLCAHFILWQLLHIAVIKAIPETIHRVLTVSCQKEPTVSTRWMTHPPCPSTPHQHHLFG